MVLLSAVSSSPVAYDTALIEAVFHCINQNVDQLMVLEGKSRDQQRHPSSRHHEQFMAILSGSCWDISVWIKVVNQPTNQSSYEHYNLESHSSSMVKISSGTPLQLGTRTGPECSPLAGRDTFGNEMEDRQTNKTTSDLLTNIKTYGQKHKTHPYWKIWQHMSRGGNE